jgi:lon-related putative ATP-dependent protease
VEDFLPRQEPANQQAGMLFAVPEQPSNRYKVNVIADRRSAKGAPVVFEPNPTYHNLFGQIEKKAHMGGVSTDFTLVKSGSLLRADGGFLIMEIEALLMNPVVWEALKRALQNKLLFIEDIPMGHGYATSSLRPEPIPLDVKVILIGGYQPFEVLQNYDSRFNKIFKVRADFDHETKRNDNAIQQYARFVARVCQTENLLPFTPEGVATLVEFGEKYTSNKSKLSIRFGPIVGIIKEANYWAGKDGAEDVSATHVFKAFNEHRFRYNLYEEKIHESYLDKTILIDVKGAEVGQVNALAVYQMGDISFGRPSRITAETFMGKAGVVNIEREANMSGRTHDKGVLILSGFLGRTFAQHNPLSLSISITFEQSYSGIDGDSASSTELYAILSSLSGFPIDQGIAVTGSVNQKGAIQAIGGANQKIEGFYDVCQTRGLTGSQGVMIPKANVQNLMLKKEVVDAVVKGDFHIYQVATIEEGIQILTGKAAGTPDQQGNYPEGTVFGNVQKKLQSFYEKELRIRKRLADS